MINSDQLFFVLVPADVIGKETHYTVYQLVERTPDNPLGLVNADPCPETDKDLKRLESFGWSVNRASDGKFPHPTLPCLTIKSKSYNSIHGMGKLGEQAAQVLKATDLVNDGFPFTIMLLDGFNPSLHSTRIYHSK